MESMQASLEAEAKGRAEAMRMKKKLETDINELEVAVERANVETFESQKTIKRVQMELRELAAQVEEEERARAEVREALSLSEKRANALHGEVEESRTLLEQADRGRRQVSVRRPRRVAGLEAMRVASESGKAFTYQLKQPTANPAAGARSLESHF